jgi:hypothetical protein
MHVLISSMMKKSLGFFGRGDQMNLSIESTSFEHLQSGRTVVARHRLTEVPSSGITALFPPLGSVLLTIGMPGSFAMSTVLSTEYPV